MNTKIYYLILIVISLSITNCKDDNSVNSDSNIGFEGKSSSLFDATFTNQTIYFDSTEIDDVISIDTVEQIYRFKKTSVKANELKENNILLIYGTALRKVVSVNNSGNEIIVETTNATLNEAIKDGTIEWTTYCDFKPENQFQIQMGKNVYQPTFQSGDAINFDFELNGYEYKINMALEKTSTYMKFEVSKKIGSAIKGTFVAEGRISAFESSNKIKYSNSKLTTFSNQNQQQKGDLTLTAIVAGSGNDKLNFELPIVLMQYPLMVGPIPTLLKWKLQLVVNAVVPLDGSAQVAVNFKYDSETGFNYDGSKFNANGKIGNFQIKDNKAEFGASSAIAINYGIGFPRLEIGLFGDVVVPWIQTAFLANSDYTFNPLCKQTRASFIGACGYNFEFLGLKMSGTKTLWQEDIVLQKTGKCS